MFVFDHDVDEFNHVVTKTGCNVRKRYPAGCCRVAAVCGTFVFAIVVDVNFKVLLNKALRIRCCKSLATIFLIESVNVIHLRLGRGYARSTKHSVVNRHIRGHGQTGLRVKVNGFPKGMPRNFGRDIGVGEQKGIVGALQVAQVSSRHGKGIDRVLVKDAVRADKEFPSQNAIHNQGVDIPVQWMHLHKGRIGHEARHDQRLFVGIHTVAGSVPHKGIHIHHAQSALRIDNGPALENVQAAQQGGPSPRDKEFHIHHVADV
mmetsp:Transcript_21953/g.47405  ORF Transcript_21953/g.47405 Transcript_21953/m.47405 type:complete len:261 (-) Transcript_21953:56-838(-)